MNNQERLKEESGYDKQGFPRIECKHGFFFFNKRSGFANAAIKSAKDKADHSHHREDDIGRGKRHTVV
jgi:hypothetical protein